MKNLLLILLGIGTLMGCAPNPAVPAKQATLITNVRIIDGKGTPAFDGAVRISDGMIQAVGGVKPDATDFIVDGGGLVLTPGFIDTHSHHDSKLFDNLSSPGAVSQGITTLIVGQDGSSSLPLEDFFARLEDTPAALNIGSYSGHGSVRMAVMGDDIHRAATDDEIKSMASLVEADMAAGSLGLSTGLEYEQAVRSTTDEVVRLAAVAGASGGRYISHLRSEDTYFWKALEEIIEVGEQARLPVQVSHIKLAKISSWGETDRLINRMNAARKAGVDITADIYPYTYWSSTIRVFFPELDYDNPERANYAVTEVSTPGGIHLATWMPDPSLEGKTLAEIAALRGDEPARVLMDMISELSIWEQANETAADDDADSVIVVSMTESDISRLMQWEHTNICSDGSDGGGHPRGYGTFPRVLGHYVRTKGVMDLALAVHKMTGLSADHMGIKDRGTLAAGMAADLVLFDPERIIDKATIEDPMRRSEGIVKVWVNGQIVYADGKTTGMLPGKVVRRQ